MSRFDGPGAGGVGIALKGGLGLIPDDPSLYSAMTFAKATCHCLGLWVRLLRPRCFQLRLKVPRRRPCQSSPWGAGVGGGYWVNLARLPVVHGVQTVVERQMKGSLVVVAVVRPAQIAFDAQLPCRASRLPSSRIVGDGVSAVAGWCAAIPPLVANAANRPSCEADLFRLSASVAEAPVQGFPEVGSCCTWLRFADDYQCPVTGVVCAHLGARLGSWACSGLARLPP